jgi:methylmalonyl-CoA epimerase
MFARVDHIGVAVEDLDAAIALYAESLQMELVHREVVEQQGVEAVLLDVGENHVELLRPLGPDTPVGKFLAKRGPGLHHVAYQVADIDAALAQLKAPVTYLPTSSSASEAWRQLRAARSTRQGGSDSRCGRKQPAGRRSTCAAIPDGALLGWADRA